MTIQPGFYDFTIEKGSTFRYVIVWKTDNCTPIDLTNVSAELQARAKLSDSVAFMTLSTSNGGIIIDEPLTGKMTLYMDATDTSDLAAVKGVYDLQVNFNSGTDVGYLLQGKMTVQEMVTR